MNAKDTIKVIRGIKTLNDLEDFRLDEDRTSVLAAIETRAKELTPKAKPAPVVKRYNPIKGFSKVRFVSNGLSKHMRDTKKVRSLTADHAQLLVDKGLGAIYEEDINRVLAEMEADA